MADPIPGPIEKITQLVLNFEICQSNDCSELTFVETTGLLSETNLTGWDNGLLGSSNPTTGDATSAVLTITLASGNTYDIDLFETMVDNISTTSTISQITNAKSRCDLANKIMTNLSP